MTHFRGLDAEAVASLFLRAVPDVSVMAFTRELTIESMGGLVPTRDGLAASEIEGSFAWEALPSAHWPTYEPLFRAAVLQGESSSAEIEAVGHGRAYVVSVGHCETRRARSRAGCASGARSPSNSGSSRSWNNGIG